MVSRYGTHALADGLRPGCGSLVGDAPISICAPESAISSMAGSGSDGGGVSGVSAESVIAFMAGFAAAGSVVTSMAGFAAGGQPHPPGGRTTTPASFR